MQSICVLVSRLMQFFFLNFTFSGIISDFGRLQNCARQTSKHTWIVWNLQFCNYEVCLKAIQWMDKFKLWANSCILYVDNHYKLHSIQVVAGLWYATLLYYQADICPKPIEFAIPFDAILERVWGWCVYVFGGICELHMWYSTKHFSTCKIVLDEIFCEFVVCRCKMTYIFGVSSHTQSVT